MAAKKTSKTLTNNLETVVDEALAGIVASNPGLNLLKGHRVVIRDDVDELRKAGQVTLVSGGGSGHEPAHGGFVGKGMLTAAVAGSIFTSPPTKSILAAVRAVGKDNNGGTLMIIKNYTGDRLNFGFAAEQAKAEGLKVEMIVVGEDCALSSKDKSAGRRGLCGTVLIHKIAGAMAEEGKSLKEILAVVTAAAQSMGTMSVSLYPCNIPGSGPSFVLPDDEIELGLGIHGEPGIKRAKIEPVNSIVRNMIEHMTNVKENPANKLPLKKGDRVALIINNLGGTSCLELNIVAKAAIEFLVNSREVMVDRVYCGAFMTSLDMAGVSLTLLHLNETIMHYLDSDTSAPCWPRSYTCLRSDKEPLEFDFLKEHGQNREERPIEKLTEQGKLVFKVINQVADAMIKAEAKLNELDNAAGDGDCGSTLKRGADDIKKALGSIDTPGMPCNNVDECLREIADIVEQSMGGSSGAFYSLFLIGVSTSLKNGTSLEHWSTGLECGLQSIMRYGGAEPGDRTMIDALHPASEKLKEELTKSTDIKEACEAAVKTAESGAQSTAQMQARAGRASYVSSAHLTSPDAGAIGVATWLRAAYTNVFDS